MQARVVPIVAAMAGANTASAQLPEATRFVLSAQDTGNHNGIIEPSEAVLFTATADMRDDGVYSILTPAIWNPLPGIKEPGVLFGFGAAMFNVLSLENGHTGQWSQLALTPTLNILALHGNAQPDGSVLGVGPAQLSPPFSTFDQRDPLPLWSGVWTPDAYAARTVRFELSFGTDPHFVKLLVPGHQFAVDDVWEAIGTEVSFQVVPAPGAVAVLGLAGGLLLGRRRRSLPRPPAPWQTGDDGSPQEHAASRQVD